MVYPVIPKQDAKILNRSSISLCRTCETTYMKKPIGVDVKKLLCRNLKRKEPEIYTEVVITIFSNDL